MEKVEIAATKQSPSVILDPQKGYFEIAGNSFPNNSFRFYLPILEWLDQYCLKPRKGTLFAFKITYQNSSSLKMFNEIIKKLERLHSQGVSAKVEWHYLEEDEDLCQVGNELQSMYTLPFECISIKE